MATLVLGDVHGCYGSLRRLLAEAGFDRRGDRLWLVGDLVNRGPDSLAVLRWARRASDEMGERFVVVLGNHDVHLLARGAGVSAGRDSDLLDEVLAAPDAQELLDWLRRRPLVHRQGRRLMVHAGLLPAWSPSEAERLARRVEERLRAPEGNELLARRPPEAPDARELHAALQVFTRARTLTADGELCDHSGPPDQAPPGCVPWYRVPGRRSAGAEVYFGHWAALGLYREPGVNALDSGAAWGGSLSALRLEDDLVVQVPVTETEPADEKSPHAAAGSSRQEAI